VFERLNFVVDTLCKTVDVKLIYRLYIILAQVENGANALCLSYTPTLAWSL
jgi:hypothetical protein